ncbi:VanZ family protein [Amycolatopsis antarctica]|nr:VanZ family protein [Amycolatopsis antarctica]
MLQEALSDVLLDQPGVLPAGCLLCLGFGLIAWFSAEHLGWSRGPAVLAATGLAVAVSVTLMRFGSPMPDHPSVRHAGECRANSFSLRGVQQWLNLVMLAPFGFLATIAVRRAGPVMFASASISAAIEFAQAYTGLGFCESQDFLNNTAGAVAAALAARALLSASDLRDRHLLQHRGGRHRMTRDTAARRTAHARAIVARHAENWRRTPAARAGGTRDPGGGW